MYSGVTYMPTNASYPQSETVRLLTDSCITVGCVDRLEPYIMQAADQVTVVGEGFDLCSSAGCVLTGPMFLVAVTLLLV